MANLFNTTPSFGRRNSVSLLALFCQHCGQALPTQQAATSATPQSIDSYNVYRVSFGGIEEERHSGIVLVPTLNENQGVGDLYHLTPSFMSQVIWFPEVVSSFSFERRTSFRKKELQFVLGLPRQRESFNDLAMNTPSPFLCEQFTVAHAEWVDDILERAKAEFAPAAFGTTTGYVTILPNF
jgi:hypothetical protein